MMLQNRMARFSGHENICNHLQKVDGRILEAAGAVKTHIKIEKHSKSELCITYN